MLNMRKNWQRLIVFIALFGIGCGTASAQKSYKDLTFQPLTFTPPQIERQTLDNGMKVFFAQDHELPVISMYALIKTGDMYEPEAKIGLAAMTAEVMQTGGTTHHAPDEVNEILEYLAAKVDVNISGESGTVELWTLKQNLDASLEVYADILRNPLFDQAKVDLAKNQMLEMIRRRNDTPESIRSREFMRLVYGKMHPLARIPQIETINNISRDDLAAFHRQYVQPNNIMLSVTGDFDPKEMLQKLNTVFGDWQRSEITFPPVEMAKYAFAPSVHLVAKDLNQTNIAIGHLGIKADNPDFPAVRVLDLILGSGGYSSRLYQEVRNKRGLAYTVGSYFGAGTRDYDAFLVYCGTRNDAVRETISVILEQMKKITETEVSDAELAFAKDQYLNSYIFKFATVDDIVQRKMFYEYVGYPPDYLETFRENVMNVTKADVLRVAKTYLHPDKMVILAVGKKEEIQQALAAFGTVEDVILEPVE